MMEDTPAVILDCGTSFCRAGFSNEPLESPPITITSIVGMPKPESPYANNTPIIGESALKSNKEEFLMRFPIQYGHVTNWDEMQHLWQSLICKELKAHASDHPFLLVQPCNVPSSNLEKTAQIFFEIFDVPSLCVMPSGELSLLASGKYTGVAVEIGGGACFCVPIVNGYGLRHLQQRTEFSGRDLTSTLSSMIIKDCEPKMKDIAYDVVNTIKEKYCYCVKNYNEECRLFSKEQEITHHFTDANGETKSISIGMEQFQCPESLFKPGLAKKEFPGLHEIVLKCLMVEDTDVRNEMALNILLCGGSSLFPGLAPRLQQELETLSVPEVSSLKMHVSLSPFRHAAFQGGKVAAHSANFLGCSMSKNEYDENGPFRITKMFRR